MSTVASTTNQTRTMCGRWAGRWDRRRPPTAPCWPSSAGALQTDSAWDPVVPNLTGRHTYMTSAEGRPCPEWDDLIAAFHDHGVLPDDTWQAVRHKTLSKDYRRRFRARLLGL